MEATARKFFRSPNEKSSYGGRAGSERVTRSRYVVFPVIALQRYILITKSLGALK